MTDRKTLRATGAQIMLQRSRFTNQERLETPLNRIEALAVAHDQKVPLDCRILALHRAMDLAINGGEDSDRLWGQIGACMQDDFEEDSLPIAVLVRFNKFVPFHGMRSWSCFHIKRIQHQQKYDDAGIHDQHQQAA